MWLAGNQGLKRCWERMLEPPVRSRASRAADGGAGTAFVERRGLGENAAMNERTGAQLRVIKAVMNALGAVNIPAWLFGGWGIDARIGRITREHGDIEFWLERVNG
jgi:Aminoglycoside-2''-adenylyltransferase